MKVRDVKPGSVFKLVKDTKFSCQFIKLTNYFTTNVVNVSTWVSAFVDYDEECEVLGVLTIKNEEKEQEKPKYKHDCTACTFLGRYLNYDLYYCSNLSDKKVIARYGNDCPDYIFGWNLLIDELQEAQKRAVELGLCTL